MALAHLAAPRPHIDGYFLREYRDHVGSSLSCECLIDGPAAACDVGVALYNAATRGDWEERKPAFLKHGKTGSP